MHYHSEPDLTLPDIKAAKTASIALQQGNSLSENQAIILLDWVAFNARYNIAQQNSYDADFSIKDASLAMECGFGQGVTAIPL